MKLDSFKQEVFSTGTDSSQYGMEMNGTAVSILSDNLYQHKIAAIVRELSTNAADSHIDSGKSDVPIKVILPNEFNPNFVVEDFGVGLNDEDVRLIFACYFKSTKQDSNDVTGAFGLGSKSPFSYTSSFTIQSRKDGVETTYTSMMGEDWIPELRKLFSRETDEENGVKVSIPVKREDFKKFYNEASAIYSFVSVPVHVTNSDFQLFEADIHEQIDEKGYALMAMNSPSNLYSRNRAYALMGGVVYPLPYEFYNVEGFNIAFRANGYSDKSVIIPFETGELQPAASRESLSMNETTQERLRTRIKDLVDSQLKELHDAIENSSSVFEALDVVKDLSIQDHRIFKYKGKRLNQFSSKAINLPYSFSTFHIDETSSGKMCRTINKLYGGGIKLFTLNVLPPCGNGHSPHGRRSKEPTLYAFYRDDETKSGLTSKCRRYARENMESSDICMIFHDQLTDHKRNRISKILNDKVQWVSFSDVREDQKSNEPRRVGVRAAMAEKKDSTINAISWTKNGHNRADNVEITDDKMFFRSGRLNMSNEVIRVDGTDTYRGESVAWLLEEYYGKEVVILCENKTNSKKMDKMGIKPVSNEAIKSAVEYCEEGILLSSMKIHGRIAPNGMIGYSILETLHNAGVKRVVDLQDKVNDLTSRVEAKHERVFPPHVTNQFVIKINTDLVSEIDHAAHQYERIGCSGYLHTSEGRIVSSKQVFARMIAFCENNGYTVEEAIKEEGK